MRAVNVRGALRYCLVRCWLCFMLQLSLPRSQQELMKGELALTAQEVQCRGGGGALGAGPLAGLA